jgi:predicted RNA-binding Zn ribbon-like protein
MPLTNVHPTPAPGHAHDVGIEVTFDFLNTLDYDDGFPHEKLTQLDDALELFVEKGVIHLEGADRLRDHCAEKPRVTERHLERVRQVRAALREVSDAVAERRAPDVVAIDEINRALHARQVIELTASSGTLGVDHRHVGDPVDDALARLSEALVLELTNGQPERIKICANDTCRWIFYDTSRTGQRRWCDMATCGNRAKAARHRARAKTAATN